MGRLMIENLYNKIQSMKVRHFFWSCIILSVLVIVPLNTLCGLLRRGKLDPDLLLIGSINAMVVALMMSMVLPFRAIRNHERETKHSVGPLANREKGSIVSASGAPAIYEKQQSESRASATGVAHETHLQFTETLLKAVPVAVFFKNTEGRYIGCNEEFTRIMGVSSDDLVGKTVFDLWPGEQSEIYHQKDMELLQNPEHQSYEFKVTDCRGAELDVVFNKAVFMDEQGKVGGIIGAFLNISARKHVEEQLGASNTLLQALIQAIPDVVYFKDDRNRYMITNKAMEEFTGLSREFMVGRSDEELLPPDLAEECRKSDETVKKTCEIVRFEERCNKGSLTGYFETIKAPVFDDRGNLSGLVGVSRDITARKQMEEDLRRNSDEKENLIAELQKALDTIKRLHGILPICAWCKKIRDDRGYWTKVESYIREHSEAEFSHGICPECVKKFYPEYTEA